MPTEFKLPIFNAEKKNSMKLKLSIAFLLFFVWPTYGQLPPVFDEAANDRAMRSAMVTSYLTPKAIVWHLTST